MIKLGGRDASTRAILSILAAVVLIAVAGGLWFTMEEAETGGRIPAQIGGLKLVRTVTGQEALADLRQMHGSAFGLTGGYVAYYEKRATVWVGDTASEQEAQALIAAMVKKISAGNRVFTNLKPVKLGGRDAYTVEGMGQQHVFYYRDAATVWVAAPVGSEAFSFTDAVEAIR